MKYKAALLGLLIMAPFFLTACTISELPVIGKFLTKAPVPVTLTIWGLWEKPSVFETLIAKYQQENSHVTIQYEDRSVMTPDAYKDRVVERLTQGTAPDIVTVHSSWMSKVQDKLSSISKDIMTVDAFKEKFYPSAAADAVFGTGEAAAIKGLPLGYDGLVLVYNVDHFNEIGQVGAPTAWEEFRRLALELTVRSATDQSKIERAGAALGTANNINHFSDILGLMWAQAGIELPGGLDTKPAQDAFKFYLNFVREDKVWSADFPEAKTAFAQGKVSMIFVPSWGILDILQAAPDMNIGVAPVPQAIPDDPRAWPSYWIDVVPLSSPNTKEAWKFLNFMTQEENQLMLFSEASKVRPFGVPYSLVALGSELSNDKYVGPVIDTAPFAAKSMIIAARSGNARAVEALRQAVELVLSGELTEEEALTKAKPYLQE